MDRWIEAVSRILEQAPTRARPLSQILRELERSGMPAEGRRGWILQRISEKPELFLVIPAHRIPWVPWPGSTAGGRSGWIHPFGSERDPWVVSRAKVPTGTGAGGRVLRRIQEGLQALGAGIDGGSHRSVGRWVRASREAERTCRSIMPRRPPGRA